MRCVHVLPAADVVEHDATGTTCVCDPTLWIYIGVDCQNGWVICHHSFDGREHQEQP